ncbi:periplasmic component of amino acid ABC-type transporter/signal transduction system [Thermanaerovibrio velox DSM 12556]|uniref:Periplasmic component of amino acid ABC-type transporter/signal transduction system n=1 Tax=Thermanaerovibrio velox DSM 12556 TaxID=926567 RepID=H0UN07_9BACT|nr:transporter substrate-binding domain-containing protein [Thermanaerovibrio velox]EHM09286.1 periplasmic component of amino acid ABC-type transporter/signal transduction system [Thermanaerovibrio velox DSM 12556]
MVKSLLRAVLLAQFVLFCVTVCPGIGAERVLVAAADPWPPYFNPRSQRLGMAAEIVREALRTQGYRVSFKVMPWDAAQRAVYEGKADMLIDAWFTKERQKKYLVSSPYAVSRIVFFKRKDSSFQYRGRESLTGLKVGLVKGYSYDEEFLSWDNYRRDYDVSFVPLALKVASRKLDLALNDRLVGMLEISEREPWLLEVLDTAETPLREATLHVMVSRNVKDGEKILKAFEKGLLEMKRSGQYRRILAAYGAEDGAVK